MPRAPKVDPEKIKALEQKLAKVRRDLNRQRAAQQDQARRDDNHRKIIAGALAETHALKNPGTVFADTYVRLLKEYVLPRDRWLFADTFRALLPPHEAETLLAEPVPPAATNQNKPAAESEAAE